MEKQEEYLEGTLALQDAVTNLGKALHYSKKIESRIQAVWEQVKQLAPAETSEKAWRNVTVCEQEVFIDPTYLHAYTRLNSCISQFNNCRFLGHPKVNALAGIKLNLESICDSLNISHEKLIKY